jgi:hypothetical protein
MPSWSAPLPPSSPYKRLRPSLGPHRTHPSSPSLLSKLEQHHLRAPCHRRFAIIAWPSRRLSILGEHRTGFTVLPSPRPTLTEELLSSRAAGGQAPVSMPPRNGGLQSTPSGGPKGTKPLVVHELWTKSTIISYCKIILKPENPHHLTNNPPYLSIIKLQSTFLVNRTLGFENISRYTPSHFQKL